jgi:hypothetical protein
LGVEHDERAGDPVGGVERVVVDEASCAVPAQRGVERCARFATVGRWQLQAGGQVVMSAGPGQERADDATDRGGLGEPGVDVVLGAGVQVAAGVV